MGVIPNVSSALLLFPLFHHSHSLTSLEQIAIFNLAFVSWLYHSSRENDIEDICEPSTVTSFLYAIDHLQIQLGLMHVILVRNSVLTQYPVLYASGMIAVALNDIVDIDSSANKLTAILMLCNIAQVLYNMKEAYTFVILATGIAAAVRGYKGSVLIGDEHKDAYVNSLTDWSEWDKCMWHGGMSLVMSTMV